METHTHPSTTRRRTVALAILLGWWVGLPLLTYLLSGWTVLEKLGTRWVMPVGLLFHLLTAITAYLFAWKARWRWLAAVVLVGFATLTSPYVANSLLLRLESQFAPYDFDSATAPPDTVIVLGGGLRVNRFETVEVGGDGQRVILAAQAYHGGHVKQVLATGSLIAGTTTHNIGPAEAAERLLTSLEVPADRITQVTGRNTHEEMQSIRTYIEEANSVSSYGLVTSAFHMPRAMRLARAAGLDPVPMPCCYDADPKLLTILDLFPTAGALEKTTRVAKEWLAARVGR